MKITWIVYTEEIDQAIIDFCKQKLLSTRDFAQSIWISEITLHSWRKRKVIWMKSARKLQKLWILKWK